MLCLSDFSPSKLPTSKIPPHRLEMDSQRKNKKSLHHSKSCVRNMKEKTSLPVPLVDALKDELILAVESFLYKILVTQVD